jgi:SdrD B-like domain
VADALPRGVVRFEKQSYESHEKVRFWLTVTNIGGKTAEQVRLDWPILAVELPQGLWGDFSYGGAGIQLAPGESRTFEGVGNIHDIRDGKLSIWGGLRYLGGPNPNSLFSGEVPVVQTKGDLSGVVYTDKNRNGQQDAGEAAAGAVVDAYGGVPSDSLRATTDADGRYSFKGIPSGDYSVYYTLADGWIVHRDSGTTAEVRVLPGAPVQLTARAERPFSESLSATLTLDKDAYQVDEIATITITLTNSGDQAISGIQPGCNRVGDANQLGRAEAWNPVFGKGVTVGAGETKTFVVKEKVPQASYESGTVVVMCDFEPNPANNTDGPFAHDSARVSGGFGSLVGDLYYDRNNNGKADEGEAIANTRIVLHDRELGADVAEAVSDASGHVRFDHVPAGEYWARVDGPWKFEGEWGGHVLVSADHENRNGFEVVPVTQPQSPAGGGGNTPPAPAGGGGALANTGAGVLGLGLVGALLVAFGFGASVFGRRRTA